MADNGQINPPDHVTIPPTDCPTVLQHMGCAGGCVAGSGHSSRKSGNVLMFLLLLLCTSN
jgi:hypothetical protein